MHHDVVVWGSDYGDTYLACDCGWEFQFSWGTGLKDLVEAAKKHEEISDA